MIAARQELDLRPQLERLDRLVLRLEGIAPGALTFAFRPLWQMDEPAKAALVLARAQATQIYANLGLWPAEVMATLAEAQLIADGTYPNAAAVFSAASPPEEKGSILDYAPSQPRDPDGRWTAMGSAFSLPASSLGTSERFQNQTTTLPGSPGIPIQIAATTKNFRHACKRLKLDENDASDALHAAKEAHGLSAGDTCLFDTGTGDIIFGDEIIGNLGD